MLILFIFWPEIYFFTVVVGGEGMGKKIAKPAQTNFHYLGESAWDTQKCLFLYCINNQNLEGGSSP